MNEIVRINYFIIKKGRREMEVGVRGTKEDLSDSLASGWKVVEEVRKDG